jgi:peptidoglycan-associated lipoprotein
MTGARALHRNRSSERRWPRACAACLLALAAWAAVGIAEAGAQGGVRGLQDADEAPRGAPRGVRQEADEREATRIYAEAQQDLAAGDKYGTQRLLERLIARYPETEAAVDARRELYGLYSNQFRPDEHREAVKDGARDGQPQAPPLPPASKTAAPPPQAALPSREAADLPAERTQDDFRAGAGDRIFFADGTADIGVRARMALEAQAAWLQRNPRAMVTIEGHADERGTREVNMQVSERRAEVVRQRLIDLGVDGRRLAIAAFGRDRPVANCAAPACAAQNRRAVLILGAGEGRRSELTGAGEIRGRLVPQSGEQVR